jgi:Na+/proline symporter
MAGNAWQLAAYVFVIPALILCAIYAFVASYYHKRYRHASTVASLETVDEFITARGTVGTSLLAFSFFAGAMGSWATVTPAIYASYAGLLGLASTSFAVGLPIILVGYIGARARTADPGASSLPDYLYRRFRVIKAQDEGYLLDYSRVETVESRTGKWSGKFAMSLIAFVVLFNMVFAMLAEYATIGILFRLYVGVGEELAVVPPLVIACLTMLYTFFGGLHVSIRTDRLQGAASIALVVVLALFLPARMPAENLPALTTEQYGWTYAGFSSVVTQPLATTSWILMSESVWQRVWASEDNATLHRAAWLGAIATVVVTFFFGYIGFLALATGRADETTDINLIMFAFFSDSAPARLDGVPGLLALACAALMAEGTVDSFQNGIAATLSSTLLRDQPLWATRLMVLVVNIPLAILGATPEVKNVLELFLLDNQATLCCTVPILVAMLQGPTAHRLVTEDAVVLGCIFGAAGLTLYGCLNAETFSAGVHLAWLGNQYGYDYFLVIVFSSILGIAVGCSRGMISRWNAGDGTDADVESFEDESDAGTETSETSEPSVS